MKGNSLKLALKEVEVLKAIDHPNIIKYYDSFTDENYLYIVMEYAQKGDLHAVHVPLLIDVEKKKNQTIILPIDINLGNGQAVTLSFKIFTF